MAKITVVFDTGNAAFDDEPDYAVDQVLEQVKNAIMNNEQKKLYDYNGNAIGNVTIS